MALSPHYRPAAAHPPPPVEPPPQADTEAHFQDADRASLYRVIAARRDMRHFTPGATVAPDALRRVLDAAHQAPAVGLMQPWRFIRVQDPALRQAMAALVDAERLATAAVLGERQAEFLRLKVEGVRDCAELLVLAQAPDDGTVFGRRTLPREMALCSVGCAAENLWLAARAENLGLGWVSMFDPVALGALLHLPAGAQPLGIFCLGPVAQFYPAPMLAQQHWRQGRPAAELEFMDRWGQAACRAEPEPPDPAP